MNYFDDLIGLVDMSFLYDIGFGLGPVMHWFAQNPWSLGMLCIITLIIAYRNVRYDIQELKK